MLFDSEAKLPLTSQLVQTARDIPLIVICRRAASRRPTEALEAAGAEVIVVSGENESARVGHALDELGQRDIQSLLLEGGPRLAGSFLDAEEIDQMHMFVAPIAVGGRHARGPLEGQGAERLVDASRALTISCEQIEDDVLLSARLREW